MRSDLYADTEFLYEAERILVGERGEGRGTPASMTDTREGTNVDQTT